MIYATFAQLYDQLFDSQMYLDWAKFVQREANDQEKVLDLAGGAGRLAVLLSKQGHDVTVADLSPEMLSIADVHARESRQDIKLVEANMMDLSELETFSLITCFADSLCYLEDIDEIKQTFGEVKNHLNINGKFMFDVISPYQTDEVYPGYMYNYESDDKSRAFLWQSFGDEDVEHGVIHELTFFNEVEDGFYSRVSEEHFERTYKLNTYLYALKDSGFTRIQVYSDFGKSEVKDDTTRWFFIAQ